MRAKRVVLAAVVTAAGTLSVAGSAQGAVVLGADTSAPVDDPAGCGGAGPTCTMIQTVDPSAMVTAPFDGVIVQWRVRGNSAGAQESLRVVQAAGGTAYTGIATGEGETVLPGVENVFDARLPIRQGQGIGIDVPGAAGIPIVQTRDAPGASVSTWFPTRLGDGETRAHDGFAMNSHLVLNATVEPDCDGDGFGDETQDPSLLGGACPALDRALILDASKSKVRKGKTITLSGVVNATTDEAGCRSGQTVELQRKRPSQAAYSAFAQAQTTSTGSFSLVQKIKKTFEYRAVLAASAGCNPGTSNTEKVKAKRKKRKK